MKASKIKAATSHTQKNLFPVIQIHFLCVFLQPNKKGHDVSTGIIEFILDHFTEENEGTYTCQITDGGGKGQSSLVLIGDGKLDKIGIMRENLS